MKLRRDKKCREEGKKAKEEVLVKKNSLLLSTKYVLLRRNMVFLFYVSYANRYLRVVITYAFYFLFTNNAFTARYCMTST